MSKVQLAESAELSEELLGKLNKLEKYIEDLGSLAVGFSGGVDSTFLIAVAHSVLGDKAIAVTESNVAIPEHEIQEATDFCSERGIRHIVCRFDPLKVEEFRHNSPDRCYFCKRGIFTEIQKVAAENGIEYVAEGSNMDDLGDYRPGLKAVADLSVKSPLRECGLYKNEIRALSKAMGLPTWSKPAYACLASRFVYGETITEKKLKMVENAECFLHEKGFLQQRVRIHGENLARIEVNKEDFEKILKVKEEIINYFRSLGFVYTTLDLIGFRSGSMNETMTSK